MAAVNEKSRLHDICTAAIGLFAAVMLIASPWVVDSTGPEPFYKGPLIFPLITLISMLVFSIPSILKIILKKDTADYTLDQEGFPKKAIIILVFLVLFVFGIVGIGLELSVFIFTSASLYFLGFRAKKIIIFLPVITAFLLWFLFKFLLEVWFQTPYIFQLFME